MRFYPGFAPLHTCFPFITRIVGYYEKKKLIVTAHVPKSGSSLNCLFEIKSPIGQLVSMI